MNSPAPKRRDLNAAVGNRPASTPVWAGGSRVYLKVYHEEQQPISADIEANPNTLIAQLAWRYWEVDLEGNVPPREMPARARRSRERVALARVPGRKRANLQPMPAFDALGDAKLRQAADYMLELGSKAREGTTCKSRDGGVVGATRRGPVARGQRR